MALLIGLEKYDNEPLTESMKYVMHLWWGLLLCSVPLLPTNSSLEEVVTSISIRPATCTPRLQQCGPPYPGSLLTSYRQH